MTSQEMILKISAQPLFNNDMKKSSIDFNREKLSCQASGKIMFPDTITALKINEIQPK